MASIPPGHRLVWTSGQVPIDAAGEPVGKGDWEAQTRAAMRNVGAALIEIEAVAAVAPG